MAALGNKPSLPRGTPFKLASAVAGANTIDFVVPAYEPGRDFSAVFQAVGTTTSLASALQISLDGGTTFTAYIATFLAAATAVFVVSPYSPAAAPTPLVAGAIFRINVTAATGPCDIWVTIN